MRVGKHTPGPWKVGAELGAAQLRPRIQILRDVSYVEGLKPTTYLIGDVGYPTTTGNTVGAEERQANALLISAAPDLLYALEDLVLFSKPTKTNAVALSRAYQVIAKARGEK